MTFVNPRSESASPENPQDPLKFHKIIFLSLHLVVVARICFQIYAIVEGSKYNSYGFQYYHTDEVNDARNLALGICYLGIELLQVVCAVLGVYRNKLFFEFHLLISLLLLLIQFVWFFFIVNVLPRVVYFFFLIVLAVYSFNLNDVAK